MNTAAAATSRYRIRPAAVAGMFYPADPQALRNQIQAFLDDADAARADDEDEASAAPLAESPPAILGPHAGYRYSGPVAASVYRLLRAWRGQISRVVLIGPAHRVAFSGIATVTANAFDTPLGDLLVDMNAIDELANLPFVYPYDEAHAPEHGLEVHLPFLIETLGGDFKVLPLLFGDVSVEYTAKVLDRFWGKPSTLVVVSTDLSHFYHYEQAKRIDCVTVDAILAGQTQAIGPRQACGHTAVQAAMQCAKQHGAKPRLLDLRNSGDTSGPRDEVVGYTAIVYES